MHSNEYNLKGWCLIGWMFFACVAEEAQSVFDVKCCFVRQPTSLSGEIFVRPIKNQLMTISNISIVRKEVSVKFSFYGDIEGDLTLGGDLQLEIIDLDQLSLGSEYRILKVHGELDGQFDGLPEGGLIGPYLHSDDQYHDIRITYEAGDGNDIALYLTSNGSDLIGTSSDDQLIGSWSEDYLVGGHGDDQLIGGLESDVLTGGKGSDRFVFQSYQDSSKGKSNRDVITDFKSSHKDKIDLSALSDDLAFIGSDEFTGVEGEVRFSNGLLQLNTDRDSRANFEVQLIGVDSLDLDDFIF